MRVLKSFFLLGCIVFTTVMISTKGIKKVKRYLSIRANTEVRPIKRTKVSSEKPFVVIIPSYNNAKYCKKNLTSVFKQNYDNYRIIYIDDASTDKTGQKAEEIIQAYGQEQRCTLICNRENKKMLYNVYYAARCCEDDEILFVLDGDDWLAHTDVLQTLNRYYQNKNVWMTYGSYITYPRYETGLSRCANRFGLLKGSLRKKEQWIFSQPRTFYAGLFKSIQLKDFLDVTTGQFYPTAGDIALMYPMLEMAREHAVFIPKILYIYNRETPLNDDKVRDTEQKAIEAEIRSRSPYAKLVESPTKRGQKLAKIGILIESSDHPMQLYALLESIEKYASGYETIAVAYRANKPSFERGYQKVKTHFQKLAIDWKPNLEKEKTLNQPVDYLVRLSDMALLKDKLNFQKLAQKMEKAGADYFPISSAVSSVITSSSLKGPLIPTGEGSFLYQMAEDKMEKSGAIMLKVTQTKKSFFERLKTRLLPRDKSFMWGLAVSESPLLEMCMAHLPTRDGQKESLYSDEELNERFLEGKKIDIKPFHQVKNSADIVELYPYFIDLAE